MTRKDCLHYEVCRFKPIEIGCKNFKDKCRYVEQKHGHWEEIRNAYGKIEGWIHAKCGRETNEKMKHCPNCGAKMDGKEDT